MEMMKQPYVDVMVMPVKRFQDLIKWKYDLEAEKQRLMKEENNKNKFKK